jgi:hypothetical protein
MYYMFSLICGILSTFLKLEMKAEWWAEGRTSKRVDGGKRK